jgi:hypothetical protein
MAEVAVDRQRYSQLFQSICRFNEQTIPEVKQLIIPLPINSHLWYRLLIKSTYTLSRRYQRWLLIDKGIPNCFRVYVDLMSRRYQRWLLIDRYYQLFQSICRFYEQTIPEVTVDRQRYYQRFHRVNVDFMSRNS